MAGSPETPDTRAGPAFAGRRFEELEAENARLRAALAEREQQIDQMQAAGSVDSQIRLVADAMPVLISFIDADRRYRYNNKAYEAWFARPRRELLGRRLDEVLSPETFEAFRPFLERALAGERVSTELGVGEGTPGERFVQLDYVPARGQAGEVLGFYSLIRDISEFKQAERALRESEARFRAMADCAPAPVWVTGPEGIEFVNRAFAEVAGVPAGDLTGETWTKLIHPEDLPPVIAERARAWEEKRSYAYDARFRTAGGELRWMHVSCRPRMDDEGRLIGYVGMAVDMTEQKQAVAELRESEARFRAMADSAPAPVWVTDEEGIEFANQSLADFTGLSVEALRGDTWTRLCHPEDLSSVQEVRALAWQTREPYEFEARFRRHDGEWRWLHASCKPREHSGAFLGYVGMAVDVTESRRAEEDLRAESRMLATLNRVGAALAAELELERLVQMVTDAGVELTGAHFGAFFYTVENQADESFMLYTISGVDRSEFDKFPMPRNTAVFSPTFKGEGVVRSDDITKDPRYGQSEPHRGMPEGHLPVRSYLAVPVTSRSGEVIGGLFFGHAEPARFTARHEQLLVGIAGQAAVAIDNARLFESAQREIAERSRAEQALVELNQSLETRIAAAIAERERAEEALRQAQKMEAVGQLTGGIAHDFNNLLTVIAGNLDMAARRLGTDADPKLLRAIGSASIGAERAATLTQRLLAFSRRQPLAPKAIDTNALLAGMSDLLHRTLGETVEVETRLAAGLWRIEVDPHQLESAILNLAVNARDAMPDGGRLVIDTAVQRLPAGKAEQGDDIAGGDYVLIRVCDTGSGMNADTLKRAVEPFFTTKEVGKGTGLGLSMVYGFVRQSGGHLRIESEEGQGTKVHIYLPRMMVDAVEEEQAEAALAPRGAGEECILVCEDDEDVRAYTVELLGELGYEVLEAADGPSTLRLLEEPNRRIDLLFTDVVLPAGMSGAELAANARKVRPDLKILFTTGYARDAIVHEGRLDPGVELVTKPFSFADLASRIRSVLDR